MRRQEGRWAYRQGRRKREVIASAKCQFCGVEIVFMRGGSAWQSIADGRDKCPTLEKPIRRHCPVEPR